MQSSPANLALPVGQQQQHALSSLQPPLSPAFNSSPHHAGSPAPSSSSAAAGLSTTAQSASAGGVAGGHSALSPPSGVPHWQSRLVSESVFDSLHGEIVRYFTAQLSAVRSSAGGGDDSRTVARRVYTKVESLGFHVGQRYVERCSRDHPSLDSPLDVVKFVCKELWSLLYKKQIDKLQTNYKGIYVLHDVNFRWLQRVAPLSSHEGGDSGSGSGSGGSSASAANAALVEQARVYTALACGIVRGALWNLGLTASVKADMTKLPAVQFTIVSTTAATGSASSTSSAGSGGDKSAAAASAIAAAQGGQRNNAAAATGGAGATRPRNTSGSGAPRPGVATAR